MSTRCIHIYFNIIECKLDVFTTPILVQLSSMGVHRQPNTVYQEVPPHPVWATRLPDELRNLVFSPPSGSQPFEQGIFSKK